MSGANLLPVNAVANSSNFSVAPRAEAAVDIPSAAVGAERQELADSGRVVPHAGPENLVASAEDVNQAVQDISERINGLERKLEFSVNEDLGKIVVTVFDKASDEIIRQIPGEQAIAIAEHIACLLYTSPSPRDS